MTMDGEVLQEGCSSQLDIWSMSPPDVPEPCLVQATTYMAPGNGLEACNAKVVVVELLQDTVP